MILSLSKGSNGPNRAINVNKQTKCFTKKMTKRYHTNNTLVLNILILNLTFILFFGF